MSGKGMRKTMVRPTLPRRLLCNVFCFCCRRAPYRCEKVVGGVGVGVVGLSQAPLHMILVPLVSPTLCEGGGHSPLPKTASAQGIFPLISIQFFSIKIKHDRQ